MVVSGLFESTVFRLGLAGARWEERYAAALAGSLLKPKHAALLALVRDDRATTQQDLARALRVAPSLIVMLADHLVGLGAVERVRDPTDRRRQRLRLTPSGHALLEQSETIIATLDRELERALGARASRLHSALDVLVAEELASATPTS